MRVKKLFASLFVLFLLQALVAEEWYVCLASFTVKQNAENYAAVLEKNGLPSWVYFSSTPKGDYYRVLYDTASDTLEQAHKVRDSVAASKGAETLKLKGLWVCTAQKEKIVVPEPVVLTSNADYVDIVSDEKPYSVHIQSYKEEPPAIRDKERLEKNDIDAYILKSYNDDSFFTFDLHAGAFENPEETEPLIEKLEELGIEGAELSDYADIKDSIDQYNEIIDTNTVSYSQGNYEIPDSFSPAVQRIISEYPINQNFQLEKIEIYDVDNIRNDYGTTQDFETVENIFVYIALNSQVSALSRAEYKDSLFGRQFVYTIATGPENCFDTVLQEVSNAPKAVYVPLKVKDETYDSWYILDENGFVQLEGFSKEHDAIVMLESYDFTAGEFEDFLDDFTNDSSILLYPQIRKNLLTLPKKNENKPRDFIFFELEQLTQSYAEGKGYVEWSIPIVGHWHALTVFIEDSKKISTEFFDLDYDYNASQIHQMFMNLHDAGGVSTINHPVVINDTDGWYVNTLDYNEVSFSNKVYIVAIDSYFGEFFSEPDLLSFAEELQIWDIDAK